MRKLYPFLLPLQAALDLDKPSNRDALVTEFKPADSELLGAPFALDRAVPHANGPSNQPLSRPGLRGAH